MDVLRNGGERAVLFPRSPTALSHCHHLHGLFVGSDMKRGHSTLDTAVRLQRTHDQLNWNELSTWVSNVNAMGHVAELCVIDDESDAIYHLTTCLPTGVSNAHEFTGR